jgi:hypothetical protein
LHDFSSASDAESSTRRGKWRFDDDEPVSAKRTRGRRALPSIETFDATDGLPEGDRWSTWDQTEIVIPNEIRSVKRVSDRDPRVVLAVSKVLGQDFSTPHGTRGFDDRGVPVRKLEPLARVQRRRQDRGRDVSNGKAAERLDEPDGLLVRDWVRPAGRGACT